MKLIDVVIPTRNRLKKLLRCLRTIPGNINGMKVSIKVIFDGDELNYWRFVHENDETKKFNNIETLFVVENIGAVACRNLVIPGCGDGVLYATDDIEFFPGAIKQAMKTFNKMFPDNDGVIGFHQIGNEYHPTGVALVGQSFLNRYPERKLFYPGYYHFACQEILWLAEKHNKFYLEEKAIIKHYHPINFKHEADQTHIDARVYKKKDMALIEERKSKGLIWGDE